MGAACSRHLQPTGLSTKQTPASPRARSNGNALEQWRKQGRLNGIADLKATIEEGAGLRIRPKAMTVATIFAGLPPNMLIGGVGSEVMALRRPDGRRHDHRAAAQPVRAPGGLSAVTAAVVVVSKLGPCVARAASPDGVRRPATGS